MKNYLHFLVKKLTILFTLLLFINVGFSQTIYNDYQDGKIWFKLKKDQVLHPTASRSGKIKPDNSNLKLATMPFLRKIFLSHSVTNLARPFTRAYSSEALLNTYLIEFSDINNIEAFIIELEESGTVDYAEKVPLDKIDLTPNDQFYNASQMWGLFQINAGNAWNVGLGSAAITVATTDNAIEIAHPDLVNQIWTNTAEIPNNGLDDDNNGYVDDVNGFDVGDNDNDPSPPSAAFSHGTHVAGTTGAESNNTIGVASIGYGISIMPVKSTRDNAGSNSITNGYDGIFYAAVNNADVINCSWGGTGFSNTGQNIVNFAWNNGSIVVAAAGNDGTSNDATPHYPSNLNNVISVASSTTNDVKSGFSNYGNTVDITAPGSNIASTVPFGGYSFLSGTSMASPMVAGLLGLMKSLNPSMPNVDLINCMYSSADNIDGANPSFVGLLGAGRINAFAAMNCVGASLNNAPTAEFTANFTTINAGGSVTFTDLSTFGPTTWSWNFDNQGLGGVSPTTANTQGPHNVTYSNIGVYEVTLTVTNANGSDTETKTAYINVTAPGACEVINLDTTGVPFHFGWSPTLYGSQDGGGNPNGAVSGVNGFDDLAKVDYFNSAQTSGFNFMIGTYIWIGNAFSSTPSKTIDVNVYDGTGGVVGAIIATKTLDMAFAMANIGLPYIAFDNAVPLPASGEVFVGVDFSNLSFAANDTFSIVTNLDPESIPNTAWEQWSDNTWHDYPSAWGLSVSHYIMPWLTNDLTINTFTASAINICEGDLVSFDATGSTFQDTLLWTFNGGTPNTSNNVMENVIYNTAGTYTAMLQVIGGGCSRLATDSVTITVNATPSLTITTSSDTICSGNSVTLTASGATGYLWTPTSQTTASIIVSPTSTTTYNVAGTTTGCTGNGSVTIFVDTPPTAAATFNPSGGVCIGANVNFDGTGSTSANNYSWSFPQGSPSSSTSTSPLPIISFGAGGTHNYSLVVTNSCGTNTFNGTITINAPTVTANSTSMTVCSGDPVTLTGGGATTYTWDNSVIDGIPFNPTTTNTYTVTGVDGAGCSNTDQITITINPLPTVTANSTSTSICAGNPVTLTGSGATSYTWDNSVVNGVAFSPTSTTTYTVTGTDGNGCSNTDQVTVNVNTTLPVVANSTSMTVCSGDPVTLTGSGATSYTWDNSVLDGVAFNPTTTTTYTVTGTSGSCSNTDQITITINPLPTVTANTTSMVICSGDPVTLTGSGATSYSWDNGVTDGVVFNPTATITYTITGTNGNGCSNTDQITITASPLPTVIANSTNTSICPGTSITLTGSGAITYTWDNSVTNGVAFSPTATTTYTVTGTDGPGCSNTDQITVTVGNVDNTTSTTGNTITANATSATYQWIDCNNSNAFIAGETGQNYTPTVNGDYAVIVTQGGCTDTSSCVNMIINGVDQITLANVISIFPNPTSNIINITGLKNAIQVSVIDVTGKLVYTNSNLNNNTLSIDVTALSKGLYFLQVQKDNEIETFKVVKQ